MRTLYALILIAFITACSHPLEIVGEGDIMSASGNRTCLLSNFLTGDEVCSENYALGDYQETYYVVAHDGWQFDHWVNYCADATPPNYDCSFNVGASTVAKFIGLTAPALVAVFTPITAIPEADIVEALGREWMQPDLFVGLSWDEINSACPSGVCAVGATLNGYDVTGLTWASVDDINEMLNAYFGSSVMGPGPDEYSGVGVEHFFSIIDWRATEEAPEGPVLSMLTVDVDAITGNAYSASVFVDSEDATIGSAHTDVQNSVASGSAVIGALLYRDTPQIALNTVNVGDKAWAQPDQFVGVSWNQVVAVCPGGLCGTGAVINGFDLDGWTFASLEDVNALFNSFLGADELGPGQDWYFEDGSAWAKAFFMAGFRETGRISNVFRFVQGATLTNSWASSNRAAHGALVDRIGTTSGDEARTDYSSAKDSTVYSAWFYRPLP